MTRVKPRKYAGIGAVVMLLAGGPIAEVAMQQQGLFPAGILQINPSDPSPWPEYWSKVRLHVDDDLILNEAGDNGSDGKPDLALSSATGTAEVVWATKQAGVYQIAHVQWMNGAWSPRSLVTGAADDSRDPQLSVDGSGRLAVTWWRESSEPGVFYAERPTLTGTFSAESLISNPTEQASHPTIAMSEEAAFIAYEVQDAGFRSVVVQKNEGSGFTPAIIAITTRQECLDVDIQHAGGYVWVSWIDSQTHLGWSKLTSSGWSSPSHEPYSGQDDVQRARLSIKRQAIR